MSQTEPVIAVVQGETKRFRVRVRSKATGSPIDLTDAIITSEIKRTYTAAEVEAAFTIEAVDLADGVFDMVLDDEKSAVIVAGRHVFDVRIEFQSGDVKKRPRGQIVILPGVTNG